MIIEWFQLDTMALLNRFHLAINLAVSAAIIMRANSLINVSAFTHNNQQSLKSESAKHKDVDYTQHITLVLVVQRSSNKLE
jgi:hypothetical protein